MEIEVKGHLRERNGLFYCALSYKGKDGKRKQTLRGTGLPIKNNKRKAEKLLEEYIASLENELNEKDNTSTLSNPDEILFSDYMLRWLESKKPSIELTTYNGYCYNVKTVISPYFQNKGILLKNLKSHDIQDFYDDMIIKGLSSTTVRHLNANINSALKKALRNNLISYNLLEDVELPKKKVFHGKVYNSEQLNILFNEIRGTIWEMPIILGGLFGLRRSEVLGLKYSAINFESKSFIVNHTVVEVKIGDERKILKRNITKNKSSKRTLPLNDVFVNILLTRKAEQEHYKELCGDSYYMDDKDYVCVNELGQLIRPEQLSRKFKSLAKKAGLEKIRFHDLRHTAASILLAKGVSMKQIQEWLGHSDFGTTANTYSHLDANSKKELGNIISDIFTSLNNDLQI